MTRLLHNMMTGVLERAHLTVQHFGPIGLQHPECNLGKVLYSALNF